jgi:carbonic anhydrase
LTASTIKRRQTEVAEQFMKDKRAGPWPATLSAALITVTAQAEAAARLLANMKKTNALLLAGAGFATLLSLLPLCGCSTAAPERRDLATLKQQQAAATPAQVLAWLQRGNERFVSGKTESRDMLHDQRVTAAGQYPRAVILSCIDSRAPAEFIFDTGLGDLFNARIAGNIADPDLVGSMEFACKVSGAKLVVVMGHTSCGAIKGACDRVQLGNLTGLLEKIQPAVEAVHDVPGERSSKNNTFVEAVAEANVRLTVERIRELSPILRGMEAEGVINMVGCIYNLDTGRVRFLDASPKSG